MRLALSVGVAGGRRKRNDFIRVRSRSSFCDWVKVSRDVEVSCAVRGEAVELSFAAPGCAEAAFYFAPECFFSGGLSVRIFGSSWHKVLRTASHGNILSRGRGCRTVTVRVHATRSSGSPSCGGRPRGGCSVGGLGLSVRECCKGLCAKLAFLFAVEM